jgi:uncharacterized NAD(P)/FAD-binding protein YdhS
MRERAPPLSVAIVGGGYTGAVVAYNLARALTDGSVTIRVVEPRPALGAGVAYSTPDPAHRINVPADRMSIASDAPSHFVDWIRSRNAVHDDPEATMEDGRVFPRRHFFGAYVAEEIAPLLESGRVVHVRDEVSSIKRRSGRFALKGLKGTTLEADVVVLATTHPAPAMPAPLRHLAGQEEIVGDIYDGQGLHRIEPDARVLIVGNGLTAADAIATLDARGHRGSIVTLSRHGLRSRGHSAVPSSQRGDFSIQPARTALDLLRRIRREVALASGEGVSWHAVFDALREQAPAIWPALPLQERARLVHHLRTFWDVHRFRAAPQVTASADRRIAEGSLTVRAGRLLVAPKSGGGIDVSIRLRGSPTAVGDRFDRIVVTTGPDHESVTRTVRAIASLHASGDLRADSLGLGLDVSATALAIDERGNEVPGLYVAGPLARASVGELMGLPQVTRHAEFVAGEIARFCK